MEQNVKTWTAVVTCGGCGIEIKRGRGIHDAHKAAVERDAAEESAPELLGHVATDNHVVSAKVTWIEEPEGSPILYPLETLWPAGEVLIAVEMIGTAEVVPISQRFIEEQVAARGGRVKYDLPVRFFACADGALMLVFVLGPDKRASYTSIPFPMEELKKSELYGVYRTVVVDPTFTLAVLQKAIAAGIAEGLLQGNREYEKRKARVPAVDWEKVEEISRADFEAIEATPPPDTPFHEARRFFRSGPALGILILDKVDHDWSYVVLHRLPGEDYKTFTAKASIGSESACEGELRDVLAQNAGYISGRVRGRRMGSTIMRDADGFYPIIHWVVPGKVVADEGNLVTDLIFMPPVRVPTEEEAKQIGTFLLDAGIQGMNEHGVKAFRPDESTASRPSS